MFARFKSVGYVYIHLLSIEHVKRCIFLLCLIILLEPIIKLIAIIIVVQPSRLLMIKLLSLKLILLSTTTKAAHIELLLLILLWVWLLLEISSELSKLLIWLLLLKLVVVKASAHVLIALVEALTEVSCEGVLGTLLRHCTLELLLLIVLQCSVWIRLETFLFSFRLLLLLSLVCLWERSTEWVTVHNVCIVLVLLVLVLIILVVHEIEVWHIILILFLGRGLSWGTCIKIKVK